MPDPDWGAHCGDLWRGHVLRKTGQDIVAITGASPRNARDMAALMRRLGARSLADIVNAVHGPALSSLCLARRGDIARRGWALGVVRGEEVEFYGGVMIPLAQIDQAWSVAPHEILKT